VTNDHLHYCQSRRLSNRTTMDQGWKPVSLPGLRVKSFMAGALLRGGKADDTDRHLLCVCKAASVRYLMLCLLLTSCASTKPWHYAAEVQPEPVTITMTVVYGDYDESDVVDAVQAAVVDFAYRTRIIVDVVEYRRVEWQSREFAAMSRQSLDEFGGRIETQWVLMVYRKTMLEWFMLFMTGANVEGMAEPGGHWLQVC